MELIGLRGIWHSYGNGYVLRGVSLDIGEEEVTAVVGINGAGKTTLAKVMAGLLKPSRGRVERSGLVGYVPQNPEYFFFEDTVFDEVAFGPRNLGMDGGELERNVRWALRVTGLEDFENRNPHTLSGGEKKRLAIACVLSMRPLHLVLDEPLANVDPPSRARLMTVMRNLGNVILVTHDMSLVLEMADRVVLLHGGKVVLDEGTEEFFREDLTSYGLGKPITLRLAKEMGMGFIRTEGELFERLNMWRAGVEDGS